MNIKIFNRLRTSFDVLRGYTNGFEGMVNSFCDSVKVIDIVVISDDVMIVKYDTGRENLYKR